MNRIFGLEKISLLATLIRRLSRLSCVRTLKLFFEKMTLLLETLDEENKSSSTSLEAEILLAKKSAVC